MNDDRNIVQGYPRWKRRLHQIIIESDTWQGKAFDVVLLVLIVVSTAVVTLESVAQIRAEYHRALLWAEWILTGLFTVEYVLRLLCVPRPGQYARSFFGIVDLLAILPTYLNLLLSGAHYLMIVRILRLLRVFRIFKLARYLSEADVLLAAIRASRPKITVFLWTVLSMVFVIGAIMYLVEGEQHGFTSIPRSVYWAIVTLTTVGYGDMSPTTPTGQFLACFVMIMGYGIIAVPTGIVSVELHQASAQRKGIRACPGCGKRGHDEDAAYCNRCASPL